MGQRHQLYIRIPAVHYGEGNPNNTPAQTLGFHHQWLYGATAVQVLDLFLQFYDKNQRGGYSKFAGSVGADEAREQALVVLSYLPASGKIESLHDITGQNCCENPMHGDNNDGITIIDLTEIGKPRYAFGSLGHTEGRYSLDLGVYSAEEYLASYWDPKVWAEVEGRNGADLPQVMERLAKVPVLSLAEVQALFPAWTALKPSKAA